jgi:hypothetical protein
VDFKRPNRPRRNLVNTSELRDAQWQQSYASLKSPQPLKQSTQDNLGEFEFALPHGDNAPSVILQSLQYLHVPFNIGLKLGRPKIDPCLGQDSIFTSSMVMPKTPMYKNTDPESRQYNIRFSRQVFAMKSEPIAVSVQKAPDCHFRPGAFPFDASHHPGSCGAVNDIHLVLPQNSVVS